MVQLASHHLPQNPKTSFNSSSFLVNTKPYIVNVRPEHFKFSCSPGRSEQKKLKRSNCRKN